MKRIKSYILTLLMVAFTASFTGCEKADHEFVHPNNFIVNMVLDMDRVSTEGMLTGKIYEYDKDGNLLPEFDASKVENIPAEAWGGSGVITFIVPPEDHNKIDLTNVFLRATLTWDEKIVPSLTYKRHNILVDKEHPEGMIISVISGTGEARKYRIMGIYE